MLSRVTLTLPRGLLARIDDLAHRRGLSRSAVIRSSLETALAAEDEQALLSRARQLYAEIESEDRTLAGAYASLLAETVPPYSPEGEDS
jgi:metal-responsive CopG/Arc/MetJ family transcriptional regulator